MHVKKPILSKAVDQKPAASLKIEPLHRQMILIFLILMMQGSKIQKPLICIPTANLVLLFSRFADLVLVLSSTCERVHDVDLVQS